MLAYDCTTKVNHPQGMVVSDEIGLIGFSSGEDDTHFRSAGIFVSFGSDALPSEGVARWWE